jgi:hypothetical protein
MEADRYVHSAIPNVGRYLLPVCLRRGGFDEFERKLLHLAMMVSLRSDESSQADTAYATDAAYSFAVLIAT